MPRQGIAGRRCADDEACDGCMVQDCGRMVYALGLCSAHWQQFNRHGKITHLKIKPKNLKPGPCTVSGCTRMTSAHPVTGLCEMHYRRQLKRPQCTVVEDGHRCENSIVARGMCNKHFFRVYRYGDVNAVHKRGEAQARLAREREQVQ